MSGRITVQSRVITGTDAAAIKAAALPVLFAAMDFHQALKTVPYVNVLNSEELGRLRFFLDDTIALIETVSDLLPMAEVTSDLYSPKDGLGIVKRLELGRTRVGAPSSQRT